MVTETNGTTEATSGRLKVSQRENESGGLAAPRENSSIYGTDEIGIITFDSSGENIFGSITREKPSSGKILERLELIEKTFLSYVDGQQKHFETRLEEVKETQTIFKEEVKALKQEIYDLVSTETQIENL